MSVQIHLLSKKYIAEKELVKAIKNAAKNLKLNFYDASNNEQVYIVAVPNYGNQLEICINSAAEYQMTLDENYYPEIEDYGANLIIDYKYGDITALPFLKSFLKYFPTFLVYVNENIPDNVTSHIYSKLEIDEAKTDDIFIFIQEKPKHQTI